MTNHFFEYPKIIKFSMENQTNVEYKISFMRFSGKCGKYDKRYFSYIRTNEIFLYIFVLQQRSLKQYPQERSEQKERKQQRTGTV